MEKKGGGGVIVWMHEMFSWPYEMMSNGTGANGQG